MPSFKRNRIFTIYKRAKLNNGSYLYWVEEDGQKVKGRFLTQELFILNNQFTQMLYTNKWILFLFTLKKLILQTIISLRSTFHMKSIYKKLFFLENKEYYIISLNFNLVVTEYIEHKKSLLKSFLRKLDCYFKKDQHIKMILGIFH